MKRINYILASAALVVSSLSFTGCEDDYLNEQPTDAVSDVTVASSLENLYMAVNGIQRKLISQDGSSQGQGGEPGFGYSRDAQSDDTVFDVVANSWHRDLVRWNSQANPSSTYTVVPWRVYHQRVLNANFILKALEESQNAERSGEALYKQVKAEALAFRAHSYFMLVQTYAKRYVKGGDNSALGVPYRMEPTTDPAARNTVEEVYRNINADLDEAINLMNGTKLQVDDYNHFNSASLNGLKARVALAQQDYDSAASYASKAIDYAEADGAALMTPAQIASAPEKTIFSDITSNTNEAIWAAMTQDDQTIYFYSFYAYMSWNYSSTAIRQAVRRINSKLYDTMSETDARRAWWDPSGEMEVPLTTFKKQPYQNRKFTARSSGNAVGEYAFMRLAELYLMKAEAEARSGNYSAAQATFTKFQQTRDPEYQGTNNTGDALIKEIMNSRAIELWGEGFSWTDHKRLGEGIDRTDSNFDPAVCTVLTIDPSDNRWQWAIPQQEMNSNPLMVQNPI